MKAGLFVLVLGYLLSQFYRAFLAVLAPFLQESVGAGASDLADASGTWFLVFALMQLPVGWALDRIGPRLTTAVILALGGGGGAILFALAQSPQAIVVAMALIGAGCAPVLMASYYIFARLYPPSAFGAMAGAVVGLGSIGNIASAAPLAWIVELVGWRETVAGMAVVTLLVALAIARFVPDPARAEQPKGRGGSLLDLLRMPALWLVLAMLLVAYAPAAGLRGLWIGPYFTEVLGLDATDVGAATLIMGLAMITGSFVYGPMERLLRTRKWLIVGGNLMSTACLLALWAMPVSGFWAATALMSGIGLFGATYAVLMGHGRSFVPPHLTGRGVTLLNLFSIGGAGLLQMVSGQVHTAARDAGVVQAYGAIFLFFAMTTLLGCAVYAFSRDRLD